jgi:large subunit ribosomal protein L13
MSTTVLNPRDVARNWHVIDAAQRPLGRVATQVATLLRGKHKPAFHPSQDIGDYVVVVNAALVSVSGRKLDQKVYYRHSGFLGGLREIPIREMLQKRPERVVEHAVRGMLPKSRLGRTQYRHLRVYAGPDHPHAGQIAAGDDMTESGASE